jgi:hypothetical protein
VGDADGKRQDILIEAVPGLRLMAVLADINYPCAAKLDALHCPPSALVGQIRQIEEGSVSGSS